MVPRITRKSIASRKWQRHTFERRKDFQAVTGYKQLVPFIGRRDSNQAYIAGEFMPKANFHAAPSLT
jgi:hypothetical protein